MVTEIISAVISGVTGLLVKVEIDLSRGMPKFNIIGLADKVVREAAERTKTAIRNSDFEFPKSRVTVNFVPASVKKDGTHLDLAIALGIVRAYMGVAKKCEYAMIGELGLGGQVLGVTGVIPVLIALQEEGYKKVIIPKANLKQARLLKEVTVYPVDNLREAFDISMEENPIGVECMGIYENPNSAHLDFSEVSAQSEAKRALEIAAAGGHNVLMMGPPGSGKSMLSKRIPGIMPDLEYQEILELTKIYSVSGSPLVNDVITKRPFRSPHHGSSAVAMCGGGADLRPGEITLSHRGVLFLDEFPEYSRSLIESIRQPLEDGVIHISRATGSVTYPAVFSLIAAFNPCPCGYYGSSTRTCTCTAFDIKRYQSKISGPILDRFDVQIVMEPVPYGDLMHNEKAESSKLIKQRVIKARNEQKKRFGKKIKLNSDMNTKDIKKYCKLDLKTEELLERAYDSMHLSARSLNSVLKVARTIADLKGEDNITRESVLEGLSFRRIDRQLSDI